MLKTKTAEMENKICVGKRSCFLHGSTKLAATDNDDAKFILLIFLEIKSIYKCKKKKIKKNKPRKGQFCFHFPLHTHFIISSKQVK